MNLRQKAKRFKKLYEDALPKKPYPVIYETHREEKHYRIRHMVDKSEIAYAPSPQLFQTQIENSILRELRPVIWDNLKAEENSYTNKIIYSLDVWM